MVTARRPATEQHGPLGRRLFKAVIAAHDADFEMPSEAASDSAWDLVAAAEANALPSRGPIEIAIGPEGSIDWTFSLAHSVIDVTIEDDGTIVVLRFDRQTKDIEELPATAPEDVVRAVESAS